ncbi:hypothetical protein AOQ84DRAFT_371414 [Glonium stellatum]|uniref:Uncharacterized protein n=1 Tax=Glonium stellatum TaxID=574774 RepID=A0A8E2FBT5_9PEZI|nr:hypothetical protein AOQ84DRAFT_371414 [Glonium stellatum]
MSVYLFDCPGVFEFSLIAHALFMTSKLGLAGNRYLTIRFRISVMFLPNETLRDALIGTISPPLGSLATTPNATCSAIIIDETLVHNASVGQLVSTGYTGVAVDGYLALGVGLAGIVAALATELVKSCLRRRRARNQDRRLSTLFAEQFSGTLGAAAGDV